VWAIKTLEGARCAGLEGTRRGWLKHLKVQGVGE